MTDLAIITPSRMRPKRLERLYNAVMRTTALDTWLVAGVDIGDPYQADYVELDARCSKLMLFQGPRRTLSMWTNDLAGKLLAGDPDRGEVPRFLASMGDDHVPDTFAWDQRCVVAIEALGGTLGGWAWGPDGFRKDSLPTWWVMSSAVVRRLGYMMLPSCEHMYVDNATALLADQSHRGMYLPDVMVRHETPFHPAYRGLADEGFARVNAPAQYARDEQAFRQWRDGPGLRDDVAKLTRE